MIDNLKKASNWTLITIEDPAFLPGQSISDLLFWKISMVQVLCHYWKINKK